MFDKAIEQVQRRNKAFEQIEKLTEIEIQAIKLRNYPMLFRYLLPYCLQLEEIFENLDFPFEAYNRRSNSDILEVVKWFDDYVTNKIKTDYITIFKAIAEWTDSEERDFAYNMANFLNDETAEEFINYFNYQLQQEIKENSKPSEKQIGKDNTKIYYDINNENHWDKWFKDFGWKK